MTIRASSVMVLAGVAVSFSLVGCSSTPTRPDSTASETEPATETEVESDSSRASTSAPTAAIDTTVVDIKIAEGSVTPTNGQAQARINRPIVLEVSSDVNDQLHVHSVPEYTFPVEARSDQIFEFTVEVPGQVDVELHDLDRKVVTIQVRP